jgi:guanylate kinase
VIVVICGPGGVGKGTVARRLVGLDPKLWLSRSWTTRAQRPGEDDDAYVFATREQFEAKVAEGGFLEWAEFLGNLYGTPVPEAPDGGDVMLEIEVQGAAQVKEREPDALLVLLTAPSRDDYEERMRGRGDPDDKIHERIHAARHEMAHARELGATEVVNDELDRATAEVHALIREARAARSQG